MGSRYFLKDSIYIGVGILLITVAMTAVFFLLKGQTSISGDYLKLEAESLTCKIENVKYEYFGGSGYDSSEIKIIMIFKSDGLGSISLSYKERYENEDSAARAISVGHINMNISFGEDLGTDAFNANYSAKGNEARLSLYATGDKINDLSRKYFLIDGRPKSIGDYEKNYKEQGFTCVRNNEDNINAKKGDK